MRKKRAGHLRRARAAAGLLLGVLLVAGCASRSWPEPPQFETVDQAYQWAQGLSSVPLFLERRDLGAGTLELVCSERFKWAPDRLREWTLMPIWKAWTLEQLDLLSPRSLLLRVVDRRGTLIDTIRAHPELSGVPPRRSEPGP